MLQDKIDNIRVGRFYLIKYKYGRISGVKFRQTKLLKWDYYEAY
jgi:hypothetical protein